jgi:hypothetical protein
MKVEAFSLASLLTIGLRHILATFLVIAVVIYVMHISRVVTFDYTLDYGEGPLLSQAVQLSAGENIYRPDLSTPPYTITNYPPLYVLAQMPFIALFGPSLLAGRLISAVSTLLTAVFLALIVRHFVQEDGGSDRLLPFITACIFLAFPYVVSWSGLLRIDMLALALSTAGLYLLVRWPTQRKGLIWGGLLLVAAIYTRQSYALAAPLAAFCWLWSGSGQTADDSPADRRRRAFTLAAFVGGVSLGLFLFLNLLTAGGFFFHIVTANVNEYRIEQLWQQLGRLATTIPVLIVLALVAIVMVWRKRPFGWSLVIPYLIGGFLSTLTIGKIGSNVNYFLELTAAFSLLAGMMIIWLRPYPRRRVLLLLALSWQVSLLMQDALNRPVQLMSFRARDELALREINEIITRTEGPVLADEQMGLLALQERPLHIQPFEVTQLAKADVWDQSPVVSSIRNQEFPLILVYYPPFSNETHVERWTPEMLAAIEEQYVPSQTLAGNVLYVPSGGNAIIISDPVTNPTFTPQVTVGDIQVISQTPYVWEPGIAVNPNLPYHLAATISSVPEFECATCNENTALLYTSTDSGQNWEEQLPFSGNQPTFSSDLFFSPENQLFIVGMRGRNAVFNWTDTADYRLIATDAQNILTGSISELPQLVVSPEMFYLVFSGRIRNDVAVSLKLSSDHGASWSSTIQVDNGVSINDLIGGQASIQQSVGLLSGEENNLAIVWRWRTGFYDWPLGVWIATSEDGGEIFNEPQQIADTWGPMNSAFQNDRYYILYRIGTGTEQQLALAVSEDNGRSWDVSVVSGAVPLTYDLDRAPGLNIAPDGTIDIVFYAHQDPTANCVLDPDTWHEVFIGSWIDHCTYDVYYTYSQDNGRTFSQPLQLNKAPIEGEGFVRLYGHSRMGSQLDIASTNEYAYPIWIQAQRGGAVQAVMVQITRDAQ